MILEGPGENSLKFVCDNTEDISYTFYISQCNLYVKILDF